MTGCARSARRLHRAPSARRRRSARMPAAGARSAAAADQAGDQRADDARSLVFETAPLDEPIEILGAAGRHAGRSRPTGRSRTSRFGCATCIPDGASLRVSYGVLNLTHRDGHETPQPLVPGERYQVRIQLNDAGVGVSGRTQDQAGTLHHLLADDLAELPRMRRVTVFGGTLDLPVRPTAGGGCAAAAAARAGDGHARAAHGDPSGPRADRPHRSRTRAPRAASRSISRTTIR